MSTVRWDREQAVRVVDPLTVDALGGEVLVLDGVTDADDRALAWCRHAPCVVIGCPPEGAAPPTAVDLVLEGAQVDRELDAVVTAVTDQPSASRALVDVLRRMPTVDVGTGLVLESFAYSTLLAGPDFAAWMARHRPPPPRPADGPPVRAERSRDQLRVTLARPANRNAFSAAMRDALFEALTTAQVDRSIATVVLAGDGPVFSSGGDLTEFGTTSDVVTGHEIRTQRSVGRVLAGLEAEVTARVQGACVGAGVELAAFADRVVADPGTTFRLPELGMGLIPGAGGTVSLTRRIGRQQTARLAILGVEIGVVEGRALGLVDEVAPVA